MRYLLGTVVGVVATTSLIGTAFCEPGSPSGRYVGSLKAQTAGAPLETQAIAPKNSVARFRETSLRSPVSDAVERALSNLPSDKDEQQGKEHDAMVAHYLSRDFAPLWVSETGLNENAKLLISEFANASAWGLDPKPFSLSGTVSLDRGAQPINVDALAKIEVGLTKTTLLYARYARGGRIMEPSEMLNSNLDRKPKLLEPSVVLRGVTSAKDVDLFLQGLHPKHAQFHNLRQAYLARRANAKIKIPRRDKKTGEAVLSSQQTAALRKRLGLRERAFRDVAVNNVVLDRDLKTALQDFQSRRGIEPPDGTLTRESVRALNKRPKVSALKLLANMEQWRWMWEDMGDVHVFANIPEYMIYVYKGGKRVHSERIVVGEIGKQSSVFSRTLKHIVLRPMWRVPESIKVRELWPNLKRSGSMFRKFGLRLETKSGGKLDYRKIDWSKADIRDYEVVQPPGRKSVMGVVKFSFPSQHTIFMHDTPDKYMFKKRQRTLSHGCLRVRNPVELARILLSEDKRWDSAHLKNLISSGPDNNAVKIDGRFPIHLAYFTAWADKDGRVRSFRDIYGHEKRVSLAIRGAWKKIRKGRDHLAAVQPIKLTPSRSRSARNKRKRRKTPNDFVNAALGGGF